MMCTTAGCGKTVMSSIIIDNLCQRYTREPGTNIAYFYFDFNDPEKQTVFGCLRSLLRQLSATKLPPVVQTMYDKGVTHPSPQDSRNTLDTFLRNSVRTFLIFDALDECTEIKGLMEMIAHIQRLKLPNVRIFTASRKLPDIEDAMNVLSLQQFCLDAEPNEDIKKLVKQSFEQNGPLKRWSDSAEVRQEIEDALVVKSKGM